MLALVVGFALLSDHVVPLEALKFHRGRVWLTVVNVEIGCSFPVFIAFLLSIKLMILGLRGHVGVNLKVVLVKGLPEGLLALEFQNESVLPLLIIRIMILSLCAGLL